MTVEEIINSIHEQGVEDEVFTLLMIWMITNEWNKEISE